MGSLKAALKAFFPNNNGDTNFSSSCLVPYFDSSQNPKGCVTTSKLASVLGVNNYIDGNIDNVNTFTSNSRALVAKNATGVPVSNQFAYIICVRYGAYGVQIYMDFGNSGLYIRTTNSASGDFTGIIWHKINFDS